MYFPLNPTKSLVSVPQITVVRTESLVEGEEEVKKKRMSG